MIDSAGRSTHMEFNYLQVLHFSMWRVHCVLLFRSVSAFTRRDLYFWKSGAWSTTLRMLLKSVTDLDTLATLICPISEGAKLMSLHIYILFLGELV